MKDEKSPVQVFDYRTGNLYCVMERVRPGKVCGEARQRGVFVGSRE